MCNDSKEILKLLVFVLFLLVDTNQISEHLFTCTKSCTTKLFCKNLQQLTKRNNE